MILFTDAALFPIPPAWEAVWSFWLSVLGFMLHSLVTETTLVFAAAAGLAVILPASLPLVSGMLTLMVEKLGTGRSRGSCWHGGLSVPPRRARRETTVSASMSSNPSPRLCMQNAVPPDAATILRRFW